MAAWIKSDFPLWYMPRCSAPDSSGVMGVMACYLGVRATYR
jgi:hypothetical protein